MLLCSRRLLAASVSKILFMTRSTCGMVIMTKLCVSVYDQPSLWRGVLPQGVA